MKNKHKKRIMLSIFAAFTVSGAAAAAGAGSHGLTLVLTLAVSLGSLLYACIVGCLLCTIETLERELDAKENALWEAEYFLQKYERRKPLHKK